MSRTLIGPTIRRLRQERGVTQQALSARLGISASYLNLIEHDQRAVTASLLLKLADAFGVDLAALSGQREKQVETGLREVLRDPLLGLEAVPEAEFATLVQGSPTAARAMLALYRALRVAREDAGGIALPSGRRLILPTEEARDFFQDRANHFPLLEEAAEAIGRDLAEGGAESGHALGERLRTRHGVSIFVGPTEGNLRHYDPATRRLDLSEDLTRESRAFHLAFQLMLLEAREAVEACLLPQPPSTPEAANLIRIGLLNYAAAALLMPYEPYRAAAAELRHDLDRLATRFGVSFEQAAQRLTTLQREEARGLPFFFLRVDPAGNVGKRFSAAGFPFARFGGSCPRWIVHNAFATPGRLRVQAVELPDGAAFLCLARTVEGRTARWGEPVPVHVVALGCEISRAGEVLYADGLDLDRARVGIGLSCRLCDRPDCRSRAFPPLAHRLAMDPSTTGSTPFRFRQEAELPAPA